MLNNTYPVTLRKVIYKKDFKCVILVDKQELFATSILRKCPLEIRISSTSESNLGEISEKYICVQNAINSIFGLGHIELFIDIFIRTQSYSDDFALFKVLDEGVILVGNLYSNISDSDDVEEIYDEKLVFTLMYYYFHSMDWYAMMRSVYAPELYSSVTPEERKKALKLFDEFCLSRGVEIEDPFIPDPEFFEAFPEMRTEIGRGVSPGSSPGRQKLAYRQLL